MERQEILDKLDSLYDEADKNNVGLNETELEYKESVADWIDNLLKKNVDTNFIKADELIAKHLMGCTMVEVRSRCRAMLKEYVNWVI